MSNNKSIAIRCFIVLCSIFTVFSANATHTGYYDHHGNYIPGPSHDHHSQYSDGHNDQNTYSRNMTCVTHHGSCYITSGHARAGDACNCSGNTGYAVSNH